MNPTPSNVEKIICDTHRARTSIKKERVSLARFKAPAWKEKKNEKSVICEITSSERKS